MPAASSTCRSSCRGTRRPRLAAAPPGSSRRCECSCRRRRRRACPRSRPPTGSPAVVCRAQADNVRQVPKGSENSRIPTNLADLVGGTPMIRLTRIAPECKAEIIGKLEAYNPAGSVKDRIGVSMIEAAEAEGRIEPGKTTIVEATSGNTGIALAFVCAAKGYQLVLTMPQGMSREREGLLRLY